MAMQSLDGDGAFGFGLFKLSVAGDSSLSNNVVHSTVRYGTIRTQSWGCWLVLVLLSWRNVGGLLFYEQSCLSNTRLL